MIRERVSSSTILLLSFTAKNLRYFYVRKNAIILKCDWKQKEVRAIKSLVAQVWSDEFHSWLRRSSRSHADMEKEVSQVSSSSVLEITLNNFHILWIRVTP